MSLTPATRIIASNGCSGPPRTGAGPSAFTREAVV